MALPGALGSVKQRRSTDSASNSEGEDMEDDASFMVRMSLRARNPWEVVQCFVWLFLVVCIVYMGDRESNLISVLWTDDRVIRMALYLWFVNILQNALYIFYMIVFKRGIRKTGKRSVLLSRSAVLILTSFGMLSMCLFSYALWPVWRFLAIPLTITLFMASIVLLRCLLMWRLESQDYIVRCY